MILQLKVNNILRNYIFHKKHQIFTSAHRVTVTSLSIIYWCYFTSARYASKAMLCTVLPSPISSASIPLMPWSYKLANQFMPYIEKIQHNILLGIPVAFNRMKRTSQFTGLRNEEHEATKIIQCLVKSGNS